MHRMRCESVAKWGSETVMVGRRRTKNDGGGKKHAVDRGRDEGVGDRIAFAYRLISWISGVGGDEEDVEGLVID